MAVEQVKEVPLGEEHQLAFTEALGESRITSVREDSRLGKAAAGLDNVEDALLAVRGELVNLHLPGSDNIETVRLVTLAEKNLPSRAVLNPAHPDQQIEILVSHSGEEMTASDYLIDIHGREL
jgi:hypothetical protein